MDDPRCCGTGTCIINDEGFCWCGQQWNGTTMCFPANTSTDIAAAGSEGTATVGASAASAAPPSDVTAP